MERVLYVANKSPPKRVKRSIKQTTQKYTNEKRNRRKHEVDEEDDTEYENVTGKIRHYPRKRDVVRLEVPTGSISPHHS